MFYLLYIALLLLIKMIFKFQMPGLMNPILPTSASHDPPAISSSPPPSSLLGLTLSPPPAQPLLPPSPGSLLHLFGFPTTTTTPQPFLDRITSLFNKNEQPAKPQLDTGGQNFDRLVIREKDNEPGGDLFASLVGDKWREKGEKSG